MRRHLRSLLAIGAFAVLAAGSTEDDSSSTSSSSSGSAAPEVAASVPVPVTVTSTPAPDVDIRSDPDYKQGYKRGVTDGRDHASSGAGMPLPVGLEWITTNYLRTANPSNVEAWKSGFKAGFADGFNGIKPFSRKDADWDQLSWSNARPGRLLYNYDGAYEGTIQSVDQPSGIIVVHYKTGAVEPKELDSVASFWWVRHR